MAADKTVQAWAGWRRYAQPKQDDCTHSTHLEEDCPDAVQISKSFCLFFF